MQVRTRTRPDARGKTPVSESAENTPRTPRTPRNPDDDYEAEERAALQSENDLPDFNSNQDGVS
jgi:hypothetical protein